MDRRVAGGKSRGTHRAEELRRTYSPHKTVEQIRPLVESDEVLFLVNPVGTATNIAVLN
jgi:hypothetical protein